MPDNAASGPDRDNWWQVTEGHIPEITGSMLAQMTAAEIAEWRGMTPEQCAAEVRARCRSCYSPMVSHMTPEEVSRLRVQYGDLWGLAQLRYLGWQTDAGICPECYTAILGVQAKLARLQTLDVRN